MINPSSSNPAYYSESNDTSEFRFVLMTPNRFDPEKKVEHRCNLCGSVQIQDGFSYNLPGGFIQIICMDCYSADKDFTNYCEVCDAALDDDNHYDTYDVTNDWDLPQGMEHRASICTKCMDDSDDDMFTLNTPKEETTMSNETPIFDFPKDPEAAATEKRLDEAFQRLEDKLTSLQNYFEGRNALFLDHRNGEITMEEVEAGLERLRSRLK